MTTFPKPLGAYDGVLVEPLRPHIGGGLLGLALDGAPTLDEQMHAKLPALFAHFGIPRADDLEPENDAPALYRLVLAMAQRHVDGFKLPKSPWPPKKPIDYAYYAKAEYWRVAEAAALTCDFDPTDTGGILDGTVTKRRDLMQRSVEAGKLPEKPTPRDFLNWCLARGESFPDQLKAAIEAVERLRNGVKGEGAITLKDRAVEAIEADISARTLTVQQLQTMREVDFNERYLDRGFGARQTLREARTELIKRYAPRSS